MELINSTLTANGHLVFSDVPSNITATHTSNNKAGCFIGFNSKHSTSTHVVPLGKLKDIRFTSIFRFKLWWSTHWVGNKGSDVELETQVMLLDKSPSGGRPYVFLLPIIEGSFTTCLQAGVDDNIEMCTQSGSTQVRSSCFKTSLYMHVGEDPYQVIKDAMKVVRNHLGTFKLLEEKTPPGIVEKFGWCTWDAFYLKVNPQGVWEGVKSLTEGGCPPSFVIIDDGWQTVCQDGVPSHDQEISSVSLEGGASRLIDFEENGKFKSYISKKKKKRNGEKEEEEEGVGMGLGALVKDIKERFESVEYVYVWHGLCGHKGGVRPGVEGMPESRIVMPRLTPALKMTMEDTGFDVIVKHGVGLVPPEMAHEMFEGLHSYLQSVGIDGVKVDYTNLLETVCEDYGGRVELNKAYFKELNKSLKKYFKGNGLISSMQQGNDFMLLGTEAISLGRFGDDFWTSETQADPNGTFWLQGCHMVHCAYNSLWMGNFIYPDWDMFQSSHPSAQFHAASRAISGGLVYISDKVGKHDFELLKSLVLPDGSILRCEYHALPTRDCLFEDPLHDGKTMLKIWNLNKYTGVIGAFNCQGGGWSREARKNMSFAKCARVLTSTVKPIDIEWKNGKESISIEGVEAFAVYSFKAMKLVVLKASEDMEISLEPYTFELLTASPVRMLSSKGICFAPIGLVNMLNTGGAIQSLSSSNDENLVKIGVKGTGEMRMFASAAPNVCRINGVEVPFIYSAYMVVIHVPWISSSKFSVIEYYF